MWGSRVRRGPPDSHKERSEIRVGIKDLFEENLRWAKLDSRSPAVVQGMEVRQVGAVDDSVRTCRPLPPHSVRSICTVQSYKVKNC